MKYSQSPQFIASRNEIIKCLYLNTADENYILARWCSQYRLPIDFIWNASQCLEKYIKAALLFNDCRTHKLGHDIASGYRRLKKLARELLPELMEEPADLQAGSWRQESPESFISRLQDNGGPHVRYNLLGYVHRTEDLLKLDLLVFQIRRLICTLDAPFVLDKSSKTYRALLTDHPKFTPRDHFSPLARLSKDKNPSRAKVLAAFQMNVWFAPDWFEHSSISNSTSGANPILKRRILDPIKSSTPSSRQLGLDLKDWLFKYNFVPKDVKDALNEFDQRTPNLKRGVLFRLRSNLAKWLIKLSSLIKPS